MANPHANSLQSRMSKKRRQRAGDFTLLKRKLWVALLHAEDVLDEAIEPDLRLKAMHALSQCAGQYAKLLQIGELEARLAALEALVQGGSR